MDAITASPSPAIAGGLEFDLFQIRTSEPFIAMYGISSAFGYELPLWQKLLVRKSMTSRAIFEKYQQLGKDMKAGLKPFPEWCRVAPPREERLR